MTHSNPDLTYSKKIATRSAETGRYLFDKDKNAGRSHFKRNDTHSRYYSRCYKSFKNYDFNKHGFLNTKPDIRYGEEVSVRKNSPLIGLEIEIEHTRECAEELGDILNAYLKDMHYVCHDGSLQNYGYEIVTAPRTFSETRSKFIDMYKMLSELRRQGFTSHDNERCGLHFHVSRDYLSNIQWEKLACFVVRTHSKLFRKLSRRKDFQYCEFRKTNYDRGSRYVAINCENSNTIEFRFFRGTIYHDSFFASCEIIMSLVEFFKTSTAKRKTFQSYMNFMHKKKYKYAFNYIMPHLAEYTMKRKTINAEEKQRLLALKENKRFLKQRDLRQTALRLTNEIARAAIRCAPICRSTLYSHSRDNWDQGKIESGYAKVIIRGHTQSIRDYFEKYPVYVRIPVFAAMPEYIKENIEIVCKKSQAFGRSSVSVYSCYNILSMNANAAARLGVNAHETASINAGF